MSEKSFIVFYDFTEIKVNKAKTEICLCHRSKPELIILVVNGTTVKSKLNMNVMGVIFDSKFHWQDHIAHAIKNKTQHCTALNQLSIIFQQVSCVRL